MTNRVRGGPSFSVHTGALQVLEEALRVYFNAHTDGNIPTGLHKRVIQEVEECLLQQTLAFTRNNQVRAAHILGISRNTLRKKLAEIGAER